MGGSKPKVYQLPQQQTTTNTYGSYSIADSPEAKALTDVPLNFGGAYKDLNTNIDVDPGVGRRTDLAEQAATNRWNSAFMGGVPSFIRQAAQDRERREIRSQGAAEAQQAQYAQQQGQRGLEFQKAQLQEGANQQQALTELERRRQLLPQIVQTGGSGTGYTSQLSQPTPSLWHSIIGGAGQVGAAAVPFL